MTLAHEGFGIEKASSDLISKVASKRNVLIAEEGSDEFGYLNWIKAEGVAQGEFNTDILLMPNSSKITVLEEFLHGTQNRLGIISKEVSPLNINTAEWHAKDFMIRHQKMLGIGAEDVDILMKEREVYGSWINKNK